MLLIVTSLSFLAFKMPRKSPLSKGAVLDDFIFSSELDKIAWRFAACLIDKFFLTTFRAKIISRAFVLITAGGSFRFDRHPANRVNKCFCFYRMFCCHFLLILSINFQRQNHSTTCEQMSGQARKVKKGKNEKVCVKMRIFKKTMTSTFTKLLFYLFISRFLIVFAYFPNIIRHLAMFSLYC